MSEEHHRDKETIVGWSVVSPSSTGPDAITPKHSLESRDRNTDESSTVSNMVRYNLLLKLNKWTETKEITMDSLRKKHGKVGMLTLLVNELVKGTQDKFDPYSRSFERYMFEMTSQDEDAHGGLLKLLTKLYFNLINNKDAEERREAANRKKLEEIKKSHDKQLSTLMKHVGRSVNTRTQLARDRERVFESLSANLNLILRHIRSIECLQLLYNSQGPVRREQKVIHIDKCLTGLSQLRSRERSVVESVISDVRSQSYREHNTIRWVADSIKKLQLCSAFSEDISVPLKNLIANTDVENSVRQSILETCESELQKSVQKLEDQGKPAVVSKAVTDIFVELKNQKYKSGLDDWTASSLKKLREHGIEHANLISSIRSLRSDPEIDKAEDIMNESRLSLLYDHIRKLAVTSSEDQQHERASRSLTDLMYQIKSDKIDKNRDKAKEWITRLRSCGGYSQECREILEVLYVDDSPHPLLYKQQFCIRELETMMNFSTQIINSNDIITITGTTIPEAAKKLRDVEQALVTNRQNVTSDNDSWISLCICKLQSCDGTHQIVSDLRELQTIYSAPARLHARNADIQDRISKCVSRMEKNLKEKSTQWDSKKFELLGIEQATWTKGIDAIASFNANSIFKPTLGNQHFQLRRFESELLKGSTVPSNKPKKEIINKIRTEPALPHTRPTLRPRTTSASRQVFPIVKKSVSSGLPEPDAQRRNWSSFLTDAVRVPQSIPNEGRKVGTAPALLTSASFEVIPPVPILDPSPPTLPLSAATQQVNQQRVVRKMLTAADDIVIDRRRGDLMQLITEHS